MPDGARACFMTVDVEDWFHSYNYGQLVAKEHWPDYESRVEHNTSRVLDILARRSIRGTFFVLGWVAERRPHLVRRIADAGHEVASHGYWHEPVYSLTPDQFRDDVERSKMVLEDIAGRPVRGYRAPCFSITNWALPILRDVGFTYDSSFFPTTAHDRYGRLEGIGPRTGPFEVIDGLYEVCISCLPLGRFALPWGGGGYFRLVPYGLWLMGVERILRAGAPYVFYIHPWDMDPGQPRVAGMRTLNAMRQRVNLARCAERLDALAGALSWRPIGEAVAMPAAAPAARRPVAPAQSVHVTGRA
jgi:polysaccharide deactylase family protein, PEP-CTERM locus subfamily